MSTCVRFDTSSWLPGAVLFGEAGFGVLAQALPSTGNNGAGYCFNDVVFPGDNGKEIAGRITSQPASGTFVAEENTSYTFTQPTPGTYTALYQLYVDGVAVGAPTAITMTMTVDGDGIIVAWIG